MRITFRTNIDHYSNKTCWPTDLPGVPRKGECIKVTSSFVDYYHKQRLPIRLEVVDVTWGEDEIACELHYRGIDVEIAKASGIKLF